MVAPAVVRLEHWLETRRRWEWGLFFLCAVLPAVWCAYWKPLTSDEMFTFEIGRQGRIVDVWRALRAGADFHPPLDFLLRHLSMKAFGENETAFRLPSITAMWMSLCFLSASSTRPLEMWRTSGGNFMRRWQTASSLPR